MGQDTSYCCVNDRLRSTKDIQKISIRKDQIENLTQSKLKMLQPTSGGISTNEMMSRKERANALREVLK